MFPIASVRNAHGLRLDANVCSVKIRKHLKARLSSSKFPIVPSIVYYIVYIGNISDGQILENIDTQTKRWIMTFAVLANALSFLRCLVLVNRPRCREEKHHETLDLRMKHTTLISLLSNSQRCFPLIVLPIDIKFFNTYGKVDFDLWLICSVVLPRFSDIPELLLSYYYLEKNSSSSINNISTRDRKLVKAFEYPTVRDFRCRKLGTSVIINQPSTAVCYLFRLPRYFPKLVIVLGVET
ncbi:hypothetical protein AGLY_013643 [Aphis glycines]|uniref:Uncharacterized protein n=1 Tax=Aphis glycines TaxID=307491 RepID=A0A6G0T920_APHGL|nr:hypothetical protein AGLY_013643 [Aphis glycines]